MADDQTDDPFVTLGRRVATGAVGSTYDAPASDPYVDAGRKLATPAAAPAATPAGGSPTPADTSGEGWGATALRYGTGLIGNFAKGFTFGDPLNQVTAWLMPNSGFTELKNVADKTQKDFAAQHPLVAGGAQILGSLPTYMMGEGALRAVVPEATGGGIIGTAANLVGSAARNAAVSSAEAASTTEGSIADRLQAAKTAAETGAVLGPAGEVVGRTVGRALGGASSISTGDAALGDLAINKYKIPVTAADLTDNSLHRIANDQAAKLPFSGAIEANNQKLAAWRGAIANEMGEPGKTNFTPDVMTDAKTRIGKVFDDVANRTSIDQTNATQMVGDLGQVMHDAQSVPLSEGELKALQRQVDDIVDRTAKGNGTLSGQAYQALTRTGAPLDIAEGSRDPNVAHVAGQIRDALDDAFVRSASPEDAADLVKAKYQYRVMRTVDQLAAGSRDGSISPDAFMQKVLTASRRFDSPTGGMAYSGGGNIGELARIGKLFRAPQNSGTPDRMMVNLGVAAATGAPALLNPMYAIGAPAALAANRVGQSILRSPALAQQIIDSRLAPNLLRPPAPVPAAVGAGYNALTPYAGQ